MIKRNVVLPVSKEILILLSLSVNAVSMSVFAQNEQSQVGVSEGELISSPVSPSISRTEAELIQLESTFVGDKEQPSVSYFIPWKGTGSADGLRWRIERKNDDTLNLVDRDIMLRSVNIYNEMKLE